MSERPPISIATTASSTRATTSTPISDTPVNKLTSLKRKNDTVATPCVSTPVGTGVPEKKKLKKDVMSRFNHPSAGTTTEGFAQPTMMASSSTATSNNIVSNIKPLPSLPALNGTNRFSASPSNGVCATSGAFPPLPQLPVSSLSTSVRASRTESSALHLPIPEVSKSKNLSFHVAQVAVPNRNESSSSTGSALKVQIENHVSVARSHVLHRVRVTISATLTSSSAEALSDIAWEQFLEKPILLVESSHRVTCVACEDSSLHLFSAATGTRLFPAIVVGSKASCIKVSAHYIMMLTCSAKLFLWSTNPMNSIVRNAALSPIMKSGDTVSMEGTLLTSNGAPMLTISTGKTFSYCANMGTWILISGGMDDPLYQLSDHSTSSLLSVSSGSSVRNGVMDECRPLARAQKASKTRPSDSARNMFTANAKSIAGTPQAVTTTVSHLESQVQSALMLQSAAEYRQWLGTYVRYLAKENVQSKIRETFDALLGPIPSGINGSKRESKVWKPEVLGMSKRDLLGEFLPAVGSQLCMQRLYAEYKEHLNHVVNGKSQRDSLFSKRI